MINNLRIGNQVVAGVYLGNTLIRKMYNGNLVVYDMSGGPTPCFEVVSTLVYASGDYVDVYCTGNSKWYKLNNLGSYEEYGIYAETDNLSSLTYYTGKLAILTTDDHEYRWNGSSWADQGSIHQTVIIKSPEYLERTENANGYVALEEYLTENTLIYIDFQMTYDIGGCLIGDYGTNDNDDWRFFVNYSDGSYRGMSLDFLSDRIQTIVSNTKLRYQLEIGNYYIKYSGSSTPAAQGTAKTGFTRPNQMYLFHGEGGQFSNASDLGKIYALKITKDTLVKDFIPWTDMEGNYGLYDKVSNRIFHSTGQMSGSTTVNDVPVSVIQYPVEYDTKVAPPNYVAYNTLEELELMECPYVGMYAIIGGSDLYKFSSSFEWEYISSVPCFEVVSDISLATGYFVDVYCTGDSKWYKKNNLSQFEEYGVYAETSNLSSLTYYTGKLAILTTDNHEYRWNGSSWADQGIAVITSIDRLWLDKGTSVNFDYHFGNNYMMKVSFYKDTSYSSDNSVISTVSNKGPIEFSLYNYGFYYDYHQPLNSSSPQCDTGDYTYRNMQQSAYQVTNTKSFAELYTGTKITLKYENGSQMHSSGSVYSSSNWYSGLYNGRINLASDSHVHISYVQVYDNNNNLIHDIHPVVKNGTLVMYDFKTDAEYTSSSAVYHKDGTYTFDYPIINYPVEYDTKVAPADNVHYDTLEELELMECPWIGMHATIGVDYVPYIYTADGWTITNYTP